MKRRRVRPPPIRAPPPAGPRATAPRRSPTRRSRTRRNASATTPARRRAATRRPATRSAASGCGGRWPRPWAYRSCRRCRSRRRDRRRPASAALYRAGYRQRGSPSSSTSTSGRSKPLNRSARSGGGDAANGAASASMNSIRAFGSARVDRQVGRPGLEHRDNRRDGVGRTRHQQRHRLSRPDAAAGQQMRQTGSTPRPVPDRSTIDLPITERDRLRV